MTIVSNDTDIVAHAEAAAAHLPQALRNNWISYLQHANAVGIAARNLRDRNEQLTAWAARVAALETAELKEARERMSALQAALDTENGEFEVMRGTAINYREVVELWCENHDTQMPDEPMNVNLLLSGAWQQLDRL